MKLLICLQRIRIEGIKKDAWFTKDYVSVRSGDDEDVNLDDVQAVFDDVEVSVFLSQVSFSYLSQI